MLRDFVDRIFQRCGGENSHCVSCAKADGEITVANTAAKQAMKWAIKFMWRSVKSCQTPRSRAETKNFAGLYPHKHGQEDQDRVQRDPHDVGSPTPPSSMACSLMVNSPWRSNATGPSPSTQPACHQTDGQVLGTNLNYSESTRRYWRVRDCKKRQLFAEGGL